MTRVLTDTPARPDWWHDIAMRQVRAVAEGLELFDRELAVTEWDNQRLQQLVTARREALAHRLNRSSLDLADLPYMDKYDLRERPEQVLTGLVEPVDEIVVRTSGTTGVPTVIRHSNEYLVERAAQRLRMYRAYGVPRYPRVLQVSAKPGRPVITFANPTAAGAGILITVNFAALNDENRDYIAHTLRTFEAELLSGQSMELLTYAEEVAAGRLERPAARVALSQGDTLSATTRSIIERTLGVRLFDTYGLQEVGQVAFECPDVRGHYHVNAEAVDVTIDPEGTVVVTSLVNRAMSIVNYRTGDQAELSAEQCACGRALPILRNLQGRRRPLIRARDGRGRQATALQTLISEVYGELWQLEQPQDGELLLRVTREAEAAQVRHLVQRVDEVYGAALQIETVPIPSILTSSGKLDRFPGAWR